MDCQFFREQIVLQAYDEPEGDARKNLENHLQHCSDCHQFQERFRETRNALDTWEEIDRPTDLEALHRSIQPKPQRAHFSWRPQSPAWRWLSWGVAACLMMVVSFSALAWIGVDARWKDNGLILRFGPEEVPKITEQDLIQLLQAQRQETQIETAKQLQAALVEFNEELQEHLDVRQQQTQAQLALIYRAMQSQRAEDLELIRRELQNLAGATEAELLQAQRAFEFILASHVDGMQRNQSP